MDELFGIPTDRLTRVLLVVFMMGALTLAFLAARDRTSFRLAARNIPRRKAQSALIVAGLMLATVLFSAAFTTGDTLTNSLRVQALENVGRVDVVVKAERPETDESVAGVAPLARESVPVTSPDTGLSEPRVDVLGVDAGSMKGFDSLRTASGKTLDTGDLGEDEIYLSAQTAEGLGVGAGDRIEASLVRPVAESRGGTPVAPESGPRSEAAQAPPAKPEAGNPPAGFEGEARAAGTTDRGSSAGMAREQSPPKVKVAGIYESGANPASEISMVMPLADLQRLLGEEGKINEVLITHGGPAVEGGGTRTRRWTRSDPSSRLTTSKPTP